MNKFDRIAEELGWERLYEGIGVFISKEVDSNGYLSINFPTSKHLEDFNLDDERIDNKFVSRFINSFCCNNKCKEKNMNWGLPLMIADYFGHKEDFENEIIWAKKAMIENKRLEPRHFSHNIREQL